MKTVREVIGAIADLLKITPFLLGVIVAILIIALSILSIILRLASVVVSLPFPLFVLLLVLAAYPVAKLIESQIQGNRKDQPQMYNQILWKRSRNPLSRTPIPLCPYCQRRLYIYRVPQQAVLITNVSRGLPSMNDQFTYICPEHNQVLVTEIKPDVIAELAQGMMQKPPR